MSSFQHHVNHSPQCDGLGYHQRVFALPSFMFANKEKHEASTTFYNVFSPYPCLCYRASEISPAHSITTGMPISCRVEDDHNRMDGLNSAQIKNKKNTRLLHTCTVILRRHPHRAYPAHTPVDPQDMPYDVYGRLCPF